MKKVFLTVVCFLLALMVFSACAGQEAPKEVNKEVNEDGKFLIGEWNGEAWINEVWTFKEDGTGHNENDLWPYDFEYIYKEGTLEIYQYLGETKSDTATKYSVTKNSDSEIKLSDDENGYEYTLTKKRGNRRQRDGKLR